jgi:hypothetical protein
MTPSNDCLLQRVIIRSFGTVERKRHVDCEREKSTEMELGEKIIRHHGTTVILVSSID